MDIIIIEHNATHGPGTLNTLPMKRHKLNKEMAFRREQAGGWFICHIEVPGLENSNDQPCFLNYNLIKITNRSKLGVGLTV